MKTDLSHLCDLLKGINYTVFLKDYFVPNPTGGSITELISTALGSKVEIGGIGLVTREEAVAEVRESIDYTGDEASGPLPAKLRSVEFQDLRKRLLDEVAQLAECSSEILTFWFQDGHPAYPVFWDFAMIFRQESGSTIFVGSSSD